MVHVYTHPPLLLLPRDKHDEEAYDEHSARTGLCLVIRRAASPSTDHDDGCVRHLLRLLLHGHHLTVHHHHLLRLLLHGHHLSVNHHHRLRLLLDWGGGRGGQRLRRRNV